MFTRISIDCKLVKNSESGNPGGFQVDQSQEFHHPALFSSISQRGALSSVIEEYFSYFPHALPGLNDFGYHSGSSPLVTISTRASALRKAMPIPCPFIPTDIQSPA